MSGNRTKCVLAYSGGLDTSVILGWLIERGYDVIAVYVDLAKLRTRRRRQRRGQPAAVQPAAVQPAAAATGQPKLTEGAPRSQSRPGGGRGLR